MQNWQMETERDKAIVRDYLVDLVNDGNLDAVEHYIGEEKCRQSAVETLTWLRSLFPDLHLRIEEQVGEGDKVVTRATSFGPTHPRTDWARGRGSVSTAWLTAR